MSTLDRQAQIRLALMDRPMHTNEIAAELMVSAPRARQLVAQLLRLNHIEEVAQIIHGRGRPKRLFMLVEGLGQHAAALHFAQST